MNALALAYYALAEAYTNQYERATKPEDTTYFGHGMAACYRRGDYYKHKAKAGNV